jgi:hypothetical protein
MGVTEVARASWLVPVVLLSVVTTASAQSEEGAAVCDEAMALQHFQSAVALYEATNVEAALFEFRRAYECRPNHRLLYNIGVCTMELRDFAAALIAFLDYLRGGGDAISPDRRAAVAADVERLRPLVGSVRIEVNVSESEVTLDGARLSPSERAGPRFVNVGSHRIRASASGYLAEERVVEVSAGEHLDVALSLRERASTAHVSTPPGARPTPANDGRRGASRGRAGLLTSAAVTGVLFVATGVALAFVLLSDDALEADLARRPNVPGDVETARSTLRSWALTTDILGAATAVSAGFLLYFLVRSSQNRDSDAVEASITPGGVRFRF